ncbi:MAG: hypothetical protein AB7P07_09290 [Hyphomonadaceae bacterium]
MRIAVFAAASFALLSLPATAQSPEASQAQDLTNCAGAVAALGGVNVLTYAGSGGGEWRDLLDAILARLNREPGVEGMTGRYAASAAREYWAERPRAELEAQGASCRERFGAG